MIMSQWLKSHPGSIIVSPGSLLPLLLCFAVRFPSTEARSSTRLPRGVVGFKCTVVAERNGAAARGRVEVESGVFRVLGRRERLRVAIWSGIDRDRSERNRRF